MSAQNFGHDTLDVASTTAWANCDSNPQGTEKRNPHQADGAIVSTLRTESPAFDRALKVGARLSAPQLLSSPQQPTPLTKHSIHFCTAVNQSGIEESEGEMQNFLHLPIGTPNGTLSRPQLSFDFPIPAENPDLSFRRRHFGQRADVLRDLQRIWTITSKHIS
jgi:hypothetical protein